MRKPSILAVKSTIFAILLSGCGDNVSKKQNTEFPTNDIVGRWVQDGETCESFSPEIFHSSGFWSDEFYSGTWSVIGDRLKILIDQERAFGYKPVSTRRIYEFNIKSIDSRTHQRITNEGSEHTFYKCDNDSENMTDYNFVDRGNSQKKNNFRKISENEVVQLGCRMDGCTWAKKIESEFSKYNDIMDETAVLLYSKFQTGYSEHPNGIYPDKYDPSISINWSEISNIMHCNRGYPFAIYPNDKGGFDLRTLNFFNEISGYQHFDVQMYFMSCHNVFIPTSSISSAYDADFGGDFRAVLNDNGYIRGYWGERNFYKSFNSLQSAMEFISKEIEK